MIRLIIFDLDGTLLNTIDDLAHSVNYALQACGYPIHAVESYKMRVGNGIDMLLQRALPPEAVDREAMEEMRYYFYDFYNKHSKDYTAPYPDITTLLADLHHREILLAVASNKYQSATEALIHRFFSDIPFAAILGQREGIPCKPDPQIVYDILQKTGCQPQEVLYVGDSGVDIETATRAAVAAVGVSWGFRSVAELLSTGATTIIDSPLQLLERL